MSRRLRRLWPLFAALPLAVLLLWLALDTVRLLFARVAPGRLETVPLRSLAGAGGAPPPASQCRWHRLWTWPAGAALADAPAPLDGGWVVATQDGRLAALGDDGRARWVRGFTNQTFTTGAVAAGSVVVAATDGGTVVAVRIADGRPAWQRALSGTFRHPPLALRRGAVWQVVLLSVTDGVLRALDAADGHDLWQSEPTDRSEGALATDGRCIAYGNCAASMYVFDATSGANVAHVDLGVENKGEMGGGLLWLGDLVYGGTHSGDLVAFDPASDTVSWRAPVGKTEGIATAEDLVTPVAAAGMVLTGNHEGEVIALDAATGAPRWRVSVSNAVITLAVVDDAVFAAAGGALHGLRLADGRAFVRLAVGDDVLGPAVNGRVLAVADDSGNVIAIGGGER